MLVWGRRGRAWCRMVGLLLGICGACRSQYRIFDVLNKNKSTKLTQFFLDLGAQIFISRPVDSIFLQHLYSLSKGNLDYWSLALERCKLELFVDRFKLFLIFFSQVVKNIWE